MNQSRSPSDQLFVLCPHEPYTEEEVQTKLKRAEERRASTLQQISCRAAAASSRVQDARETRIAKKSMLRERCENQEIKAAKLRATQIQSKRRKLEEHGKRVELKRGMVRAARVLQEWWRAHGSQMDAQMEMARQSVQAMLALDAQCAQGDFEQIETLLRSQPILRHAKALVQCIPCCSLTTESHRAIATSPRTLLASFMLCYQPDNVLDQHNDSPRQRRLQRSAQALLSSLRSFGRPSPRVELTKFRSLLEAWQRYVRDFVSWKAEDGRRVAAELLQVYAELVDFAGSHSEHRGQALDQMSQLRGQLDQLLGRQQSKACIENIQQARPAAQTGTHPAQNPHPIPAGEPEPQASAEQEQYRNWELAHALATQQQSPKPAETPGKGGAEKHLSETVVQVMHDMFANELKSGVHRMLRANLLELRENLCHLTPSPDLIQELHDGMPVESITAHEGVPADSTRLKLLLDFSVGRILLLEAPERNPETQAWHAEVLAKLATAPMEVVVPSTIKWLLGRVHGIKLEVAVIQARVLLKEHGVEYERSLAASAIADGSLDLADTQAWVAQQAEALEEMRIAPSVSTVVLAGLVSLICSPSPLQGLPQLLALDAARIHQLHDQVNRTIQLQVTYNRVQ
eukprot:TRINITY_DN2201_c0_g1_i13.p1 TRINITY_DN2201_c0_g1~~TRINITY_DN2201_c0_g1_i13.p1  ORF type:complete len:630 (+),score=142.76 TRINITY_DN2201_c0_g1_i13:201-2090(+)